MKQFVAAIIIIVSFSDAAFAHGGRTNSEGCHKNRKTGDYHCHGGKTAAPAKKNAKPTVVPEISNTEESEFMCGSKTKCAQMVNCDEAMFYLHTCGLSRLDRDKDGVPCESKCK